MVTGARKLFCWAGPLEPVVRLEVFGRHLFWLPLLVHTLRAVLGADVAEAASRSARHSGGRLVGRQSADQCSQVLYELVVHRLRRYAYRVVQVGGLSPEFESPVTLQRSRDGAQVDHHLHGVTGAVLPVLHVDDDRLAVPLRDQVGWPARVADLPWSSKLFCPSMFTSKPPCFQFAFRLLSSAVWFSIPWAWLKSDGTLAQF